METDVTVRFRLSEVIANRDAPMSQSELSRRSGVSMTTINAMALNKDEAGFLGYARCPERGTRGRAWRADRARAEEAGQEMTDPRGSPKTLFDHGSRSADRSFRLAFMRD